MSEKPNLATQNLDAVAAVTGNLYQSVVVISKRAKQIALQRKHELRNQLDKHFADIDTTDFPEELEAGLQQERIELTRQHEKRSQPVSVATGELLNDELTFRDPEETEAT